MTDNSDTDLDELFVDFVEYNDTKLSNNLQPVAMALGYAISNNNLVIFKDIINRQSMLINDIYFSVLSIFAQSNVKNYVIAEQLCNSITIDNYAKYYILLVFASKYNLNRVVKNIVAIDTSNFPVCKKSDRKKVKKFSYILNSSYNYGYIRN